MKYDVVIAGGGFAGAYCARALGRALGRKEGDRRVALIAERNVLVFQPMLAEVVGSSLGAMDVVNPLRQFCREVDVLQGVIRRVDWERREVLFDGGRFTRDHAAGFNHLVLALGSVTDLSAVPGMTEYARPMKNVTDALRLRATLINRLEEASLVRDPEVRARLLTFAIVGGGYTGVETAGQIFNFVRQARRFYPDLREARFRVVLIHSQERLLHEIGPKLGAYAQGVLEAWGVEVRLNTRVTAITAGQVLFAAGEPLEANTVVTTIGNGPNPVVMDLCRQLGIEAPRGRVPVDPTMRVAGRDCLWVAGDCAAVPWSDRGVEKISPPTAQFAVRQGKQLGQNLARVLRGSAPRPFRHRYMGQLASLGERQAVAEVFGLHFRGFVAWWLWRTIYLAKLPGILRRLRVMVDWTFDLVFPRDISVLVPPADDVVRAIHLEKGESLFSAGDVCNAFFYVRRGALVLLGNGPAGRLLTSGSVIDHGEVDAAGRWRCSAAAADSADLTAFRGRVYDLLAKNGLKLVREQPVSPPHP
jgi:NADH dehydrogenase